MNVSEIIGCVIGTTGFLSVIALDFMIYRAITRAPGKREKRTKEELDRLEQDTKRRRRHEMNFYAYDGSEQSDQADE